MTHKIPKKQKPIEHDIHLKYLCKKCGTPHWLSFKEASTKNFKIVCDCGYIFGVRRVSDFSIKYFTTKINPSNSTIKNNNIIPQDLLTKTVGVLVSYGFTTSEAQTLIMESYIKYPNNDIKSLVKQVLESLRGKNVN